MNTLSSSATINCYADQSRYLPNSIGKAEKVVGDVILDVTSPSGSIAYSIAGFAGGASGWEYAYAVK
ncbi:hypothetical protein ACQQCD_02545 [Pseudarthrobacter sp. J1763]|uniref:hypothetical protein n=1 Tax=Pseudarthrobacter sp. J1763 TaxID=3420445 RepID=UPI003D269114